MELFLLYLWLKLDMFLSVTGVLSVVGLVLWSIGWLPRFIENTDLNPTETEKMFNKGHTLLFKLSAVCVVLTLVVPSSKDTAILVGASYAFDLAKSPEGQKVGSLLRGKANELLDAELKKLQPK